MRGLVALLLLLLTPTLAGCMGSGGNLVVVASAPRLANGMTVAVAVPRGFLGSGEGTAHMFISHNGEVVYPPGGVLGAPIMLTDGKGSAFVPYANFVVQNNDYVVTIEYEGQRFSTQVAVEKWVNYVYALPYVRNDTMVVDLVLERSRGFPNARIFAAGLLQVELRYRGAEGEEDQLRMTRNMFTDGLTDFQRIVVPVQDLHSGNQSRGWYAVEATFHNNQAKGNNNVPMDPTLADSNPPLNWVFLEGEACRQPFDLPLPELVPC